MSFANDGARLGPRIRSLADSYDALRRKTDREVAELLLEHVWAHMDLASPQSALVEQAIERLRRTGAGPLPEEVSP